MDSWEYTVIRIFRDPIDEEPFMSGLQVLLSEPLAAYAAQQAQARGFGDASAFVEHLIEADRRGTVSAQTVSAQNVRTQTARTQIEEALAEGLRSEAVEVTPDWWARKRELIASVTPESAT
jgi:hypothetical protein